MTRKLTTVRIGDQDITEHIDSADITPVVAGLELTPFGRELLAAATRRHDSGEFDTYVDALRAVMAEADDAPSPAAPEEEGPYDPCPVHPDCDRMHEGGGCQPEARPTTAAADKAARKAPRRTRNRQPLASGPTAEKIAKADAAKRSRVFKAKAPATEAPAEAPAILDPAPVVAERRTSRGTVRVVAKDPAAEPRKCSGATKWGIPAHEATRADFPKNSSGPDGLDRVCRECKRRYAEARKAAAAS